MRQWKSLIEKRLIHPKLRAVKKICPIMTANLITILRLLPAGFAFWSYATAFYALAAILDWIDGAWARANREESPTGKFLDPAVDKMIVLSWLWVLHSQSVLPFWWVMAMTLLDAISQIIYGQKIFQRHGANIFGQCKKVLQDACVLVGIFAADWKDISGLLLVLAVGAALLSLGAKFQLKKTPVSQPAWLCTSHLRAWILTQARFL